MNAAWQLGYADAKAHKAPTYEKGSIAIIGVIGFDYLAGYRAGNADNIWGNNNRPPQQENKL
jgi:hypothetical protein